ncbi:MAG: helix-turn-helix domain-containing protein [Mycobacterium sp.]
MGAEMAARRKMTAREAAERFGVTDRTIRRLIAEPRAEFLARARERRAQAVKLRLQGLKYREIAEEMDLHISYAGRLLADAKRLGEWPNE